MLRWIEAHDAMHSGKLCHLVEERWFFVDFSFMIALLGLVKAE